MSRIWLAVAGLAGLVSVGAGAAAAHVAAGASAELLRTGALYGLVHAAALTALAAWAERRARRDRWLGLAGWSFAAGILLFSFSLFAMALSGIGAFGRITPWGGLALMLGWAALGVAALRRQ